MRRLFERFPFLPFVLPLFVYMALGQLERYWSPASYEYREQTVADPSTRQERRPGTTTDSAPYSYPGFYSIRILLTVAVTLLALPTYRRFPLRLGVLPLVVGMLGGIVWIGLCRLGLEAKGFEILGQDWLPHLGRRAAFNPFAAFGNRPAVLTGFLLIRFFGLVCVVPVIEEFFLRGFLMRWFVQPDWTSVPIGKVTAASALVGTMYGMLSHPAEFLAAAVWFSLITWLMWKKKSIWSCVVAHAITNLVLGLYVVGTHEWSLW